MCGRYSLFTDEENKEILQIIKFLDKKYPGNAMKYGEIYPTNIAPIICQKNDELVPELSTWGFPRFSSKGSIINARSETANERPMFKKSLHTRRCVIPSTGFFEWSQNGPKTKYRFNLPNENALYMAGIFNEFKGENKFVILTTTANISVVDVHNRMPVILQRSMIEDWIKSEHFALSYLNSIMPSLQRNVCR